MIFLCLCEIFIHFSRFFSNRDFATVVEGNELRKDGRDVGGRDPAHTGTTKAGNF